MRSLESRALFLQRLDDRLNGISTIEGASSTNYLPFAGASLRRLEIDGRADMTGESRPLVGMVAVGSRYFDALGVRMLRGRAFTATDGEPGREAMVVNQRLADMHFRGEDPVGKQNPAGQRRQHSGSAEILRSHDRRRIADHPAERPRRIRSRRVHHARQNALMAMSANCSCGRARNPAEARRCCVRRSRRWTGRPGHQHPDVDEILAKESLAAAHVRRQSS